MDDDANKSKPKDSASKNDHEFFHTEKLSAKFLWAIFAVLLVSLIAGILAADHHIKKPATSAWATYSSQKYGFKFTYLKAWGTPAVVKSAAKTGFAYTINLSPPTKVDPKTKAIITPLRGVYAMLQTANWVPPDCPPVYDCPPRPVITKAYVEKPTGSITSPIIHSDSSSYATITEQKVGYTNLVLDAYQSLGTAFQNISAAHGVISQNVQGKACPSNALSGAAGCISQNDLDNLSKFLKSISGV